MTELQKYINEKLGDLPEKPDNIKLSEVIAELMVGAKDCKGFLEEVVDDVWIKLDL